MIVHSKFTINSTVHVERLPIVSNNTLVPRAVDSVLPIMEKSEVRKVSDIYMMLQSLQSFYLTLLLKKDGPGLYSWWIVWL